MRSLAAWLLLLVAVLLCVSSGQMALEPVVPNRGDAVAQHWALALRGIVLGPVLYAAFAAMLELLHRISMRVGGWRAENLGWGRIVWRNAVASTLLAGALVSLVLSLPGAWTFGLNAWAMQDYLRRPISAIAWAAALEYLWRIAGALESARFVASATSFRSQISWRSRIAIGLVVVAIAYYAVSAVLFGQMMSMIPAEGDFTLSVTAFVATWVQEPLRIIAVAGCIEYLLRIAKALPEGKVLTHEPSA